MSNLRKFIDIGANLSDSMYQGIYNGSQKHHPDLDKVLERSWNNNLSKIIITAGNVEESKKALVIARTDGKILLHKYLKMLVRLHTYISHCRVSLSRAAIVCNIEILFLC